jgi:Domain of unknown function (DUF4279)
MRELHLELNTWGPKLEPDEVTRRLGVRPAKQFRVGERARARDVAGWRWRSEPGVDSDPMFEAMLAVFGDREVEIAELTAAGAEVWVGVVGRLGGVVVSSPEQAEARRFSWDAESGREFEPFLDGDLVGIDLTTPVIRFLAAIGASFGTHIDFELDPNYPTWFGEAGIDAE